MCTAIQAEGRFFGRNLDLEYGYDECVVVTPRQYAFSFSDGTVDDRHPAILGMAAVADGVPLYFDAMNEQGLCMAGLNFPGYAHFPPSEGWAGEIAPYELIPRVLCACSTVADAEKLLSHSRIVDVPFSESLPVSPLHWMIADRERSLVVESTADGLRLHENTVGVLTNSPDFPVQMVNLSQYRRLTAEEGQEHLPGAPDSHSKGMGAIGMPGDLSSLSRFVRAVFTKQNARFGAGDTDDVGQFFHVLGAVAQVRGCNRTADGDELTRYSCCMDQRAGVYYYTTYNNSQLTAVALPNAPLEQADLARYPLMTEPQIVRQN